MNRRDVALFLVLGLAGCSDLPTYPSNAPDEVPGDHAAYFDEVTQGYFYSMDDVESRRHEMGKTYRLLRLREKTVTSEPELTQKIDSFLVAEACDLAGACFYDRRRCVWGAVGPMDAATVAASSGWDRVRRPWSAWIVSKAQVLTSDEEDALAVCVFGHAEIAIPGFDRYAFGLRVVDEWERTGRPGAPTTREGEPVAASSDEDRLADRFEYVVAPRGVHRRANTNFYGFALRDHDEARPFVREMIARKDPLLLRTLFQVAGLSRALEILHAHEDEESTWYILFAAFAQQASKSEALDRELLRLWEAYPGRRLILRPLFLANPEARGAHGR